MNANDHSKTLHSPLRQALRLAVVWFAAALLLTSGWSALQIFGRGVYDPKWGDAASNFELFMQLVLMTLAVQAVFVVPAALVGPVRQTDLRGVPESIGAIAFTLGTMLCFAPDFEYPFLVAALISTGRVAVAVGVGCFRAMAPN